MLDAYIIDRIRREQERQRRERVQLPLVVDDRPPRSPSRERDREPESERGSVVIDMNV